MLDKRLTREVSDLLELSVADDKIVRILLVRGFTTEQIKRAIKDIRDKPNLAAPEKKQAPVSETIETGASKRVGFMNKFFNSSSEAELLEQDINKMKAEENAMKLMEAKLTNELSHALNAPQIDSIPMDVKQVLKQMDQLLAKLSKADVERFARSKEFEQYQAVLNKYVR